MASVLYYTQRSAINTTLVDPDAVVKEKAFEKAKLIFGDIYERLQRLKTKYDPECVFNRWFPIAPTPQA